LTDVLHADTNQHFEISKQRAISQKDTPLTMTKAQDGESNPFARIEDIQSLDPDDFVERFQQHGFIWFKSSQKQPKSQSILDFLKRQAATCENQWTVENSGDCTNDASLTPSTISKSLDRSFYVSTIIHRQDADALEQLVNLLPKTPDVFQDLQITGGAWLFMGHVGGESSNKRKRSMVGRAEHVDEVSHSGTFHCQVAGTKTWWLRPHPELFDNPPDVSLIPGAEKDKAWKLKVQVQEGDVFCLNTKIWYHYTELPQDAEWSMSVARDFYLPIPCPQDTSKGEVIWEEENIPDDMPRTTEPNCALIQVQDEEEDEDDDDGKIVLVALQDIPQGELLSIAIDDGESDECNANEMVDPRAISKQEWEEGQVVLQGDEIPHDLPRSFEPNCELQENGDIAELRAIQSIQTGHVFCILPESDEEYEEVEVDLATGEMQREEA
jgi:hypothetical protein